MTGADDSKRAIEAVWRIESARVIAGLTRIVRDVGLAEELAQDALVRALEEWPQSGVPDNPGAWLMTAGKNRAIDLLRRKKMQDLKHQEIGPVDDVPRAAIAKRANQLFQHLHVQLHRAPGRNACFGKQICKRVHFVGQVASPHHDVGAKHFAVVRYEALG